MRKTTVRQHTRRVNGERVPVMRHTRSLKPLSFGRAGTVDYYRYRCPGCAKKTLKNTYCSDCMLKPVAPNFNTIKYYKGETWDAVDFSDGLYTLNDGKGNTEYATPEEVGERSLKFPKSQLKDLNNAEFLNVMDGSEVWTDAFGDRFGERVCVGFDKGKIVKDGQRFTPTDEELKDLKQDVLRSEYGTTDPTRIREMEGF